MLIDLYVLEYTDKTILNKKQTAQSQSTKLNVNGVLVFPTDILNPQIRITTPIDNTVYQMLPYNWVYIHELDRYYFVENIILFRQDVYDLYLAVDVLSTWYYIGSGGADRIDLYVERTSVPQYINNLIQDDQIPLLNYRTNIQYVNIFNIGAVEEFRYADDSQIYANIMLCTTGNTSATSSNPLRVSPDINGVHDLSKYTTFMSETIHHYVMDFWSAEQFINDVGASIDKQSYINYFKMYPFEIAKGTESPVVNYANGDYHAPTRQIGEEPSSTEIFHSLYCGREIKIADFMFLTSTPNYEELNLTTYELWIPYYDFVELDPVLYHGHRLQVIYLTNYSNGESEVYLYDKTTERIIMHKQVELGYKITFSADTYKRNRDEANAKETASVIGAVATVIGSVIATIVSEGAMAGPAVGASVAAVSSAGATIASSEMMVNHTQNKTVLADAVMGRNDIQFCYLRKTVKVPNSVLYDDDNFIMNNGKPSNAIVNDITTAPSGYYKFRTNQYMASMITKTGKENQMLIDILNSGVRKL